MSAERHGRHRYFRLAGPDVADMVEAIARVSPPAPVASLREEKAGRIVLTRPAVEAGEALGFLPGDLHEKLAPYLRPLHDALMDMLPPDEIQRHMERGTIEIAPLAYMRGRTLNHAFIILDEAQNTTAEQMKAWLSVRPRM